MQLSEEAQEMKAHFEAMQKRIAEARARMTPAEREAQDIANRRFIRKMSSGLE